MDKELQTMDNCYELLNSIRDRVLRLPVHHKVRVRYRDLRRGLANAVEDVQATGTTQFEPARHYDNIRQLVEAVGLLTKA